MVFVSDPDIVSHPQRVELEVAFEFGDRVYHVAGRDGSEGVVTGYLVRSTGLIYQVTWGETRVESGHFGLELTSRRPL